MNEPALNIWLELAKIGVPSFVAAASAILSAYLTNRYAEAWHLRESRTKERELHQRLVEMLVPTRLAAYQEVYGALQALKGEEDSVSKTIERVEPHLLWIDPPLANAAASTLHRIRVGQITGTEKAPALSDLQEQLATMSGARALNEAFASADRRAKE